MFAVRRFEITTKFVGLAEKGKDPQSLLSRMKGWTQQELLAVVISVAHSWA